MDQEHRSRAEKLLARFSNRNVRPYSTFDFGRQRDTNCFSVIMPEDQALTVLPQLRAALSPGLIAFLGTSRWLGNEQHDGIELVVGPGDSQFDILRIARSDAVNHDLSTEDLVRKLQGYDRDYGISIFRAETDTIGFDLLAMPPDLSAFAKDLYKFCTDIVDQGFGSVEELEEQIRISGWVLLWWD